MKLSFVIAAVLALGVAACGGGSGAVSGKVLVDGAPAAGQEVLLQGGRVLLTATTGADGAYRFEDLPEGGYLLSVDVPSTKERHLQAAVKAPASVPDLLFTGIATLTGTVTDAQKAPVSGAQVSLLGTQVQGSTDSAGHFAFSAAPTGTHTVAVTSDSGSGQAEVTLALGETKDVPVQVSLGAPATLEGQVGFFAQTDPSLIQVSIPAANVTTQAGADGHYSLSVPPGEWDLYAKAPYYPSQKIGHVSAAAGAQVSVPPAALSLYTELPDLGLPGSLWALAENNFQIPSRQAVVLEYGSPDAPPAFYKFDLETHALQVISVAIQPILSRDGHHAALLSDAGVLVMDLEDGTSFAVPTDDGVITATFSTEGGKLFFTTASSPRMFFSVDLSAGTWESIPDYEEEDLQGDRRLIRTTNVAPVTWKLVTPQGITTAFTNVAAVTGAYVNTFFGGAAEPAFGLEACAAPPCPVDVLAPGASVAIASTWKVADASIDQEGSNGRWLLLKYGTELALIDTTTGATTPLPVGATNGSFSPDGTRFMFHTGSGTTLFDHALPLPDPATLTPVVTSTVPLTGGWISPSRYVGFDDAPTSGDPYRFTLEDGALTQDADYTAGSESVDDLVASWLGTDGVSRMVLGAGGVLEAPEGQTTLPTLLMPQIVIQPTSGLPSAVPGTKVLASWGDGKAWFFDGDAAPRSATMLTDGDTSFPFVGNLLPVLDGTGFSSMDFDSGQRIPFLEPGRVGIGFDFSLGSSTSLVLTNSASPEGAPTGGGWAILPTFLLPI